MSTEFQIAILGIVGTLSGTVLGWVLNSLSQKGKIKVFVKKWKEIYQKNEVGITKDCNREEAEYYYFNLSIDVYNSSRETKIMRDIRVLFFDKKKLLFSITPMDDAIIRTGDSSARFKEISVVNIPARSVVTINMHKAMNYSDKEWGLLSFAGRVMFSYMDDKNKEKTVEILKQ